MKKKILLFIFALLILASMVGCKKEFDYNTAMDDAMEKMQNAKQMEASVNMKFNDDLGVKLNELAKLDTEEEMETSLEELDMLSNTLSNIELVVNEKVDLDAFIIDTDMEINYEGSNFASVDMFMNDGMLFMNEKNLLNQGVIIKFDFLLEMMDEQGTVFGDIDFIGLIKNQIVTQQKSADKMFPIINQIIDENLEKPEILEATIDFNGKSLKADQVKYTLSYRKVLELTKIFLKNEEFITQYKELMDSQFEYMEALTIETDETYSEEMLIEFENGINEIVELIDSILISEDPNTEMLDKYNLVIDYYFNDGLKKIVYDFDFMTVAAEYYSVGEPLTFDIPSEDSNYVISDQMSMFGITSLINMEKIEELQNHKLVLDFMNLMTLGY
ncbi:MAG: hypothetical protein U9N10_04050 [Bacillota bacterium]|nr:hypothetical protein [Bacillota bacterium]